MILRSQESLEDKLEYIRQNPVRRGLAEKATGLSMAMGRARHVWLGLMITRDTLAAGIN